MVQSTTLAQLIDKYYSKFSIVGTINLDNWYNEPIPVRENWLKTSLAKLHKDPYADNERIILHLTKGDLYTSKKDQVGVIIETLMHLLGQVDITNFFVVLLTNDPEYQQLSQLLKEKSFDQTTITIDYFNDPPCPSKTIVDQIAKVDYRYNSPIPNKIAFNDLSSREQHLLVNSKTFCMYPWVHIHAYPTGQVFPCCGSNREGQVGNAKESSLVELWNSEPMKNLRFNMLNDLPSEACTRCYEQEQTGFFSMRKSANKHHGHHIQKIHQTLPNGHYDKFEMVYWDIRFSNLCNLRCRSCGHIFSSQWYQDQVKLAGPEWASKNKTLNFAGRTKADMLEQLMPHLDYVEQIYFAGGEPLVMDEHYQILEELERRNRFDVRLIYNTNFTEIKLKDRLVFDYWSKFNSVSVGASLDGMGPRAEYIRKGTKWAEVEENRYKMLEVCPKVDFYVSPTLSILNAWHLPDFHKNWVERGLIQAQDLNVNILQDPPHYRIDIAPMKFKQRLRIKYEEHLDWLRPLDPLWRATIGFESAIRYMLSTQNTELLTTFWQKTHQLDKIRNENVLDAIPELEALNDFAPR